MSKNKLTKSVNKLYGARVNLRGIYSKHPIVCWYDEVADLYRDGSGELEVRKNGLDFQTGCTTFASQNEEEVLAFIHGASAILKILDGLISFRSIE